MQRSSDKHGPRQDEELEHEMDAMLKSDRPARTDEWRDPEPPAEDDPDVQGWHGAEGTEEPSE